MYFYKANPQSLKAIYFSTKLIKTTLINFFALYKVKQKENKRNISINSYNDSAPATDNTETLGKIDQTKDTQLAI